MTAGRRYPHPGPMRTDLIAGAAASVLVKIWVVLIAALVVMGTATAAVAIYSLVQTYTSDGK